LCLCAATSLLYVVERLDILAKQASLQFVVDSSRTDVRIGSDAFCVRLLLSATGDVKDVQVYHGVGVRDLHAAHVNESRVSKWLVLVLPACQVYCAGQVSFYLAYLHTRYTVQGRYHFLPGIPAHQVYCAGQVSFYLHARYTVQGRYYSQWRLSIYRHVSCVYLNKNWKTTDEEMMRLL